MDGHTFYTEDGLRAHLAEKIREYDKTHNLRNWYIHYLRRAFAEHLTGRKGLSDGEVSEILTCHGLNSFDYVEFEDMP